jgi:hypothetical protein
MSNARQQSPSSAHRTHNPKKTQACSLAMDTRTRARARTRAKRTRGASQQHAAPTQYCGNLRDLVLISHSQGSIAVRGTQRQTSAGNGCDTLQRATPRAMLRTTWELVCLTYHSGSCSAGKHRIRRLAACSKQALPRCDAEGAHTRVRAQSASSIGAGVHLAGLRPPAVKLCAPLSVLNTEEGEFSPSTPRKSWIAWKTAAATRSGESVELTMRLAPLHACHQCNRT